MAVNYTRINWENLPSENTPLSAENLNKMDKAINDLSTVVDSIEPNPVGVATEGLDKLGFDGEVYEIKGGHKIIQDGGTTLSQKDNMKFVGVYTDNSGDDTNVNVVRTMTKAQIDLLTGEEAKGFLIASDEEGDLPFTSDLVEYRNGDSVTEALDNGFSNIAPVENGDTASQAYSQGSHFVWKGVRVVATSAIANGATLILYPTASYNCKAESVEDSIETKILTVSIVDNNGIIPASAIICKASKTNKIMIFDFLDLRPVNTSATSGFVHFANITGWNCVSDSFVQLMSQGTGSLEATIKISYDGKAYIYTASALNGKIFRGQIVTISI